jgi:hypothetical protein
MTRTISLITATVGAALLFAVPAYGEPQPILSPEHAVASFEANERATLAGSSIGAFDAHERAFPPGGGAASATIVGSDAHQRAFPPGGESTVATVVGSDAHQRAFAPGHEPAGSSGLVGASTYDAHERAFAPGSVSRGVVAAPVAPTLAPQTVTSDRTAEWPQIGLGVGVGLLLALGLYIAMRHTRIRPLAH